MDTEGDGWNMLGKHSKYEFPIIIESDRASTTAGAGEQSLMSSAMSIDHTGVTSFQIEASQ
eukprot:1573641-Prorocentrum_lima.AAC.1